MKHRATGEFWQRYRALPPEVQRVADAAYQLMNDDLRHPSLHVKKIGFGLHYRALSIEDGSDLIWFWIGHHAEYDRLVGKR